MLHRTTSWLRPCISARARGPVATQADLHWAWNHLDSIDLEVFWVFAWDTWDHGTAVAAMDKTPLEKALSASAVLPSPASWRLAVWPWPKMDFDMLWPFKIQNQKNMEEHGRKDPNLSNVWFVWYLIDAPFTHPTIPSCFRMSKKQMCECALACSTQQEASSDTSRPHNLFPSTLRPWPESRLLPPIRIWVSVKASSGDPTASSSTHHLDASVGSGLPKNWPEGKTWVWEQNRKTRWQADCVICWRKMLYSNFSWKLNERRTTFCQP